MGGDGGQVIDRATMVKTKGWGLTKSGGNRYAASLGEMANYVQYIGEDRGQGFLERRRTRMQNCWLSQQALQDPIVACRLGNLYNKEAVIGALLNKTVPHEVDHIRSLKDVKNCQVTWAEAEAEAEFAEGGRPRRIVCPVSREELDTGGARAVVLWKTGAIISAKTLKELKLKECPLTGQPFDAEQDVVTLVPDDEELAKLRERLPVRKRKAAASSVAGAARDAAAPAEAPATATAAGTGAGVAKKKAKIDTGEGASRVEKAKESSAVFKKLLTDKNADGFNGSRDGFGTPAYNRGSRI